MRKLFLALIPALLCAVFFLSCQKEVDPSILTGPQNDSSYLWKTIELDTTLPSGSDTVWITEYLYDGQKRLWRLVENEYDPTGFLGADTTEFRYQGNQTSPMNYRYLDGTNPDSTVNYLTYSNGFIVMDSLVMYSSGTPLDAQITRLSSAGGNRYLKKIYVHNLVTPNPPSLTLDSTLFTRTITNGNPVSGLDSVWGSGFFTTRYTFTYTYDNKHGLFKDLQFWYLGYYQNLVNYSAGFGNNNVITSVEIEENPSGTTTINNTFIYTYRSDGYPLVIRLGGTPSSTNKVLIKYTKL